jgi:Zn-dependent protease
VSDPTKPTCPQCATPVAPSLLSCPTCHALLHADRLRALAASAADADRRGDLSAALEAWRTALTLLPPQSAQFVTISSKVQQLGERLDAPLAGSLQSYSTPSHSTESHSLQSHATQSDPAQPASAQSGARRRWLSGAVLGGGLFLWKFKAIALLVVSKGKLLLLGLTKSSTLFSMLASLGVYWTAFGWRFAAGLVGSIYVHEMGHVAALRRLGIPASAPMFIPGLGAFVRLKQSPANVRENARVGLAGPIWGLGAAVAAFALWAVGAGPIWGAIGHTAAWLNLFNLLPVWQLDGGRAFEALNRNERWLACAVTLVMLLVTHEGLLVLLAIASAVQAVRAGAARPGDRTSLVHYSALVFVLSLLCTIRITI